MGAHVVKTVDTGKNIASGIDGIFPFAENLGIMLRIQVRDMHGCKIGDGVFQIIVFVVYGHFSSVWNILAEFVLINQFIAPGALFAGSAGRSQGGVIIGSKVVY